MLPESLENLGNFVGNNERLKLEITAAHLKACNIWDNDRMINFLAKYRNDLFDALMDFVSEPNYLTLEYLGICIGSDLPIKYGRVVPERFQAVMDHIDLIEDMRAVWLS